MNTQISSKLAAFSVALVMNLALIGGVAVLFDGKIRDSVPMLSAMPAAHGALVAHGTATGNDVAAV